MMGFVYLLKFAVKCLEILAWPVFGLGYPLCASIQAIETNSNSDTQKLISYWVSISVVLLFEHSFRLEWLAFWSYIKLMIVGFLVLPYFDGSLYVYKHFVSPCLSTGPRIITCQFNKRKELFFKKDDFLVEVKRYIKENGSDALEDLIDSTKRSAKPNVAEIRALAAEDWAKFEQPKLPVQFKDSNAAEITEKIEVASTKQLEQPKLPVRSNAVEITEKKEVASTTQLLLEQPKLSVRSNAVEITEKIEVAPTKQLEPKIRVRSNAVEITEKNEVASTTQLKFEQPKLPDLFKDSIDVKMTAEKVRRTESNISQTESTTFPPPENVSTATTAVGGRDLCEMLPPEKVQKVWTCVTCQVTAQSETVFNSHIQGQRHKAACKRLDVQNQTPKREVSPVSAGNKSNATTASSWIGFTCVLCKVKLNSQDDVNSHFQGKKHKKACMVLNSKDQASNNNVSPASDAKKANFPESEPGKCPINNSTPPESSIHAAKEQSKQENLTIPFGKGHFDCSCGDCFSLKSYNL